MLSVQQLSDGTLLNFANIAYITKPYAHGSNDTNSTCNCYDVVLLTGTRLTFGIPGIGAMELIFTDETPKVPYEEIVHFYTTL